VEDKEVSVMNVVPLIDIMLVLLTIVLVTSTFIATGKIPLELPQAQSAQKIKDSTQEFIEIDANEVIHFQKKEVTVDEFEAEVKNFSPQTQMIIRADKKVSLDLFVTMMDILKVNGFQNVSLQAGSNVKRK